MTKYYVLQLDPAARYDWDRCTLRDPITAERPDLARLVAEAVGDQAGTYLVSVNLEIQVLEQATSIASHHPLVNSTETPGRAPLPHPKELVA